MNSWIGKCGIFILTVTYFLSCRDQAQTPAIPEKYRAFSFPTVLQHHPVSDTDFDRNHKIQTSIAVAMEIVSNDGVFSAGKPTVVRVAVNPNETMDVDFQFLVPQGAEILDGEIARKLRLPGGKVSEFYFTLDVKIPGEVAGAVVHEASGKANQIGQAVLRLGRAPVRETKLVPSPSKNVDIVLPGKKAN